VAQANAQNPLSLTLKSQNGFTGVVLLETLPSSSISTRFNPDTVPLARISNSTLWIDPLSAGNHTITIVAISQGVSHSIDVSIIAEDLHMAFSPPSLTMARNTPANVTLTLSSLNGLSGYLNFPGYNAQYAVIENENPSRVFLSRGGMVTTIMSVFVYYPATISLPVFAQICSDPNSCLGYTPIPPGPLWSFTVNYNLTIT
jgi:hypothetical protein